MLRGELLLLKRTQRRLDEKLETLVRSNAGLASLMHEQRCILKELYLRDTIAVHRAPAKREFKKAA